MAILAAALVGGSFATLPGAEPPRTFTAEAVKKHFEIIEKLDPQKTHLYDKLVKRFGKKTSYSSDEVTEVEIPEVPSEESGTIVIENPQRTLPVPVDAFSKEDVELHFKMLLSSNPKSKATMQALKDKHGDHPWYIATELRDVEARGGEPLPIMVPREDTEIVKIAEAAAKKEPNWLFDGLKGPLIRKDWTEVLGDEDPSQETAVAKKYEKIDDLVGATFAFTNDFESDAETWSVVGAVIVPWLHEESVKEGLAPDRFALAPSVSLNRVSTNGKNASAEVDQVLYRVGVYSQWFQFVPVVEELELRAAIVYGTDSDHEARMPGFEIDLEPRLLMGQDGDKEVDYKIGYKNTLLGKAPLLEDGGDQSLLDYQLRLWLHMEGGDIQNAGKSWVAATDTFFRLGPTAQLRFNMPKLWRGFSITAQYGYMATVEGPDEHNELFKLDATLTLLSDKELRRKVSLNAGYTKGGLNFTKQDVDVLTLGMSILF
ncbi:MAG: hypothetical protein ACAH88_11725 [Roseimicrobium sp.]